MIDFCSHLYFHNFFYIHHSLRPLDVGQKDTTAGRKVVMVVTPTMEKVMSTFTFDSTMEKLNRFISGQVGYNSYQ